MGIWAWIKASYQKELRQNRHDLIELWMRYLDPDGLEAKERASRPDSYTLARCGVAAARLAALGNKLYPDIRWEPYDERENLQARVRIILSRQDIGSIEHVSLEVAKEQDEASVVRMLATDFTERARALADNIRAGEKERSKWLTTPPVGKQKEAW